MCDFNPRVAVNRLNLIRLPRIVFVAQGLTEGATDMEETEVLTIKRLPFEEVFQMTQDGRITDVLSVLAVTKIRLAGIA